MASPVCPFCGYDYFLTFPRDPWEWCGKCGRASFVSDGKREIPLGAPRRSKRDLDRLVMRIGGRRLPPLS